MLETSVRLDSLDGVTWVVDADGILTDYGSTNWSAFAEDNNGSEWAARDRILGATLSDFVKGPEVLAAYLSFLDALQSGKARQVVFKYRCDGPEIQRDLRMAITVLGRNSFGRVEGFLFQSVTLDANLRPPLPLYDFKTLIAESMLLPIQTAQVRLMFLMSGSP